MSEGRSDTARSEWLGCGKRRRKSKDIRNYGEVTSQTSKRGVLHERRNLNKELEEQSDFVQPSLKNFLSKTRRPDRPEPLKSSSPSNECTIPVSVFSSGVRKKVSPSGVTGGPDSCRNSHSSVKQEPGRQYENKKRRIEESTNILQQNGRQKMAAPPLKKKKNREKNIKSHHRSKTCPSQKDSVLQVDVKRDVEVDRIQLMVGGTRDKLDFDEDKENKDPQTYMKQMENRKDKDCQLESKYCSTVTRVGSGQKRKPLSEIIIDKDKAVRTMKCDSGVRSKDSTGKGCCTPTNRRNADKIKLDLHESELSESETILEPVDGMYTDTNELLAELSYCEKMSV